VTSGALPMIQRAPTVVMNSDEALGAVGSAWVTVFLHGGGGSRGKLGLRLHFPKIWSQGTPIYRDFGGKITYVRRILSLTGLNPLEIYLTWIVFGLVGEIFLIA
jgi:hypothetical protein